MACIPTWETDFRADLPKIDVPILVIQGDADRIREEFGDLLFSFVNFSRVLGYDAEGALREANEKFYRRFNFMERRAEREGRALDDLSLDELEELWQLAKTQAA